MIRQPEINYALYPEEPGKLRQMAFLGRTYVELFKQLGVAPDILRLNEPQLFFLVQAVENDIQYFENGYFRLRKEASIYRDTKVVLTTHTPEAAALPKYDSVSWLRMHVGEGLVPDYVIRDGSLDLARRLAENPRVAVINAVAQEHGEVTRLAVLPGAGEKTLAITNGSDPRLWKSGELMDLEGSGKGVRGIDLYEIGQHAKGKLNEYLLKTTGTAFRHIERPLAGLVRRLVEYKEQGSCLG